jgi:uncharacterized membrane protein YecN with MAPEG domain
MVFLPYTLLTASVMALLCAVLVVRIIALRRRTLISIGDGGNTDLIIRIRTHGNFIEYAPLLLIVMALLEMAGANHAALATYGAVLVVTRIAHAVSMPGPPRNPLRGLGTGGSILLLVSGGVYGLALTWARLS